MDNFILLPTPVSANRYWRNFRGRMVVSKEAQAYKQAVGWMWLAAKRRMIDGLDVHVEIQLCPKLTKGNVASKTRMDLDNCVKLTLDALNGVAYLDDSQVVSISAAIGKPVAAGGLLVDVRTINQVGDL